MSLVWDIVRTALLVFWLMLFARWIMELVVAFARNFRPTGLVALLFEAVFTVTDPPLKLLRRFIPPLRIGNFALDMSFLVLIIGVRILITQIPR